mmetsp:Transcript_11888/g.35570  ORF Transcript_11888/g.35570 Transcript_11888/m.35570 type:complete len:444 (+) Transcript_11888:82-1413(+)|eukprot:CAMPEP_0206138252 /NCGR_PEP_ID=MMETSP1473-20131121/3180_1 /ASSEMBLY_ACC=CAM_ASM_001109 /TAXON_ID=1461547 /ORGANISM="Stichococcus sp, Strain RCC1054" /LENGTH=443 /DNA_ID=CAMNT_0053531619 /DNA_START=27 /DNA_END=1358 /DNA_ORIENTATION=-
MGFTSKVAAAGAAAYAYDQHQKGKHAGSGGHSGGYGASAAAAAGAAAPYGAQNINIYVGAPPYGAPQQQGAPPAQGQYPSAVGAAGATALSYSAQQGAYKQPAALTQSSTATQSGHYPPAPVAPALAASVATAYTAQPGYSQQGYNQLPQGYVQPTQGYGQAAQSGEFYGAIHAKLSALVPQNGLQAFYSPPTIDSVAHRLAAIDWRALAATWNLPVELCLDLVGLALYDIVIYCDDSGSMKFEEGGSRIDDLKAVLDRVSSVVTLLDADGISLRAMNYTGQADGVRTSQQAAHFVSQLEFKGLTPMGEMLERRIIEPILESRLNTRQLTKPLLVITITDGEPSEAPGKVQREVAEAKRHCQQSPYGAGAIAFAFAQVGTDMGAQRFLATLDNDPDVGRMVDCTSHFELEQAECLKKGVQLTPDMWMLKLLVGGIDRSYDNQD